MMSSVSSLKLAAAQINPRIGDFAHNVAIAKRAIVNARSQGVDLLIFPELSLTGYPPRDLLDFEPFIDDNLKALAEVTRAVDGLTVVCGFVERNPRTIGRRFFNSAAVLSDKKQRVVYRKQLLPYYDVFDESRYFEPGEHPCIFTVKSTRVAVTICEDIWNASGFVSRLYANDPLKGIKEGKPDLVVNLSASPFFIGRSAQRFELCRNLVADLKAPMIFCNQVGGNDELLFDGASFFMNEKGQAVKVASAFEEEMIVGTIDENPVTVPPIAWPSSEGEWLLKALVCGIKDYVRKVGAQKVCLGLSGGIDSAVVAVLATLALGPEAVSAIGMPTRFTAREGLKDAEALAHRLGISYRVLPIETLFEAFCNLWKESFGTSPASLTSENFQPRIRMTLLMAHANEEGRLLLNTSNKSEIATGYATLYGDAAGALAVLGDLTKHQVYELAHYINKEKPIIPDGILSRPPSAELKENQMDEDTLPPYAVLDNLVDQSVVNHKTSRELCQMGFESKWIGLYERLHVRSEFKRHQLPPVLRVSPRAFGMGRRIPLACKRPN